MSPDQGPKSAQYLCGGFDEPVLFSQRCDDGDVTHRLVGVFLVLGDTQSRELPLGSCTPPGLATVTPCLVRRYQTDHDVLGNRHCQLVRSPLPENMKLGYLSE